MFKKIEDVETAQEVLSLYPEATREEIKKKYSEFSKLYHPDKYNEKVGKELSEEAFKTINEAYKLLTQTLDHDERQTSDCCCDSPNNKRKNDADEEEECFPNKHAKYDSRYDAWFYKPPEKIRYWFKDEWKSKYLVPSYLTMFTPNHQLNSNKNMKSKIRFFNLNTDNLSVRLPINNNQELEQRIKEKLLPIIPSEYWVEGRSTELELKIPKNKIEKFIIALETIIKEYKFTYDAGNFLRVTLNSEEFNLGLTL